MRKLSATVYVSKALLQFIRTVADLVVQEAVEVRFEISILHDVAINLI